MLQIETRPVDRLIPYVRNARTHSEDQIAQIAASIAEFGFVNPILIGSDDVIVAGHVAALMAAELRVDPHVMETVLEQHVRRHLAELSDVRVELR